MIRSGLLVCAVLLISCGAAPRTKVAHPAVAQLAPRCRLVVHDINVTVERPDLPRIVAKASEAVVDLPSGVADARRPLAFSGRAEALFFELKRAKTTTGAALAAGTMALRLRGGVGHLEGDFALPSGELLGVPIDCEDLVPMAPEYHFRQEVPVSLAVARMLARPEVELRARIDGPSAVRLDGTLLVLFETESRGDFSHVVRAWSDGTRIDGWVPSAALRVPDRCEWNDSDIDLGSPCDGRPVSLGAYRGHEARWPPRRPVVAVADVTPGTPVFARPGQAQWATLAQSEIEIELPSPHASWVRVHGPAGEDFWLTGAWIARAAVHVR